MSFRPVSNLFLAATVPFNVVNMVFDSFTGIALGLVTAMFAFGFVMLDLVLMTGFKTNENC